MGKLTNELTDTVTNKYKTSHNISMDDISRAILNVINNTNSPMETKEIEAEARKAVKDVTRTKLFYRLNNLRGEGLVRGKFIGPGKGVWIWWRKSAFEKGD